MGVAKYERVSRRDEDYGDEEDEEQEVELGNRTGLEYGEGSSSLTASSPSPVDHNKQSGAADYRIRSQNGTKGRATVNTILSTALFIVLYFTLSIGLTFYQSSLLEVSSGCDYLPVEFVFVCNSLFNLVICCAFSRNSTSP